MFLSRRDALVLLHTQSQPPQFVLVDHNRFFGGFADSGGPDNPLKLTFAALLAESWGFEVFSVHRKDPSSRQRWTNRAAQKLLLSGGEIAPAYLPPIPVSPRSKSTEPRGKKPPLPLEVVGLLSVVKLGYWNESQQAPCTGRSTVSPPWLPDGLHNFFLFFSFCSQTTVSTTMIYATPSSPSWYSKATGRRCPTPSLSTERK